MSGDFSTVEKSFEVILIDLMAEKVISVGAQASSKWGYNVASIQNGAVHLACQLIIGKLVRKNMTTQVTGFFVDLAGKCVEGLQMNWVSYLVK
jgi:hypothetical protein